MRNGTKAALPCLVFSIVLLFGSTSVLSQLQLEESRQFSIELATDCSAVYVYSRVFTLKTDDDEAVFAQYLSEFENKSKELLDRFTKDALDMVNRASDLTSRNMTARDFNVSAYRLQTVIGASGIIEHKFTWDGFAFTDEGQIQLGDVFEIGLVLLERDELSIHYPTAYDVARVEPEPDFVMNQERRLAWIGPRLFATGTPAVAFAKVSSFPTDQHIYALVLGTGVVGMSISAFLFHRYRRKKTKEDEVKRLPLELLEAETDEDKIVNMLRTRGGYLRQSMMVEELGFSKSRTSEVLSNMENKGLIKRHKKGREKLVVLMKQPDDE